MGLAQKKVPVVCRPDVNLGEYGFGLLGLYAAQGFACAVYESVNKAVFADHFPENKEGAFANQMIMCVLSYAIVFYTKYAGAQVMSWYLAVVVLILAISVVPSYL